MSRTSKIFVSCVLALCSVAMQAQKRGTPPNTVSPGRSTIHNAPPASSAPAPVAANSMTATNVAKPNASAVSGTDSVAVTPAVVAPKPASDVPENAAVITLHGLCASDDSANQSADKAKNTKACTMIVTRDQFDDVLSAVSLGGQAYTAGAIRNIADTYVQNLILANAALKAGVDKDPRVQKLLELVRNRTLAEAYRHAAEEKYRNPSAEEIEKYYRANVSQYEVVKVDRIFIPKFNPKAPKDTEFQKKAETVAKEVRERAAKGESADKLQSEGVMKLGIPAPAFLPENGMRRRSSFPADIAPDVFALKPGEVSKIENETGGFAIYRLIAKDAWTADQVRGEIVRDIFRQKMEADVKGVLDSVQAEMNQQYFAPAVTAQAAPLTLAPTRNAGPAGSRVQSTHSVKLPPVAPGNTPASTSTPK